MTFEARISINGTVLTDDQAMIVRLAIDALAGLVKDQVITEAGGIQFTDTNFAAVTQIQALILGKQSASLMN